MTLNPLFAGMAAHYSTAEPVGTHPNQLQKNITLAQMANDVRSLPYLAQLILGSDPSSKGSAILFALSVRRRIDNLALRVHN